jgi:hypothetical protein
MLTREEAAKIFEGETIECTPTDRKRVCVPIHNFVGAKEEEFTSWDGSKQKAKGYKFVNETDGSEQLAAVDSGVLMCYEDKMSDGRMRSEAIKEYLEKHPLAVKTVNGVADLVTFMNSIAIGSSGKSDVYTTDLGFVSKKIAGAPAKEDIQPGQVVVGQKISDRVKAFFIEPGTQFEGAEGTTEPQTAGAKGAYVLKDSSGMRLIQAEEFVKSYKVISEPKAKGKATPDKGIEM